MAIGEIALAQEDGGLPTTLAAGSAPGESGVSVLRLRFKRGAHFNGTARQHLIFFQISPQMHFECRFGGRPVRHEPPAGRLAIAPVGIDFVADADESLDAIFVAIDPNQLSFAAAEGSALGAQLIERISGYDEALLDFARTLASESSNRYPNGPLFWNEVASGFVDGLVARHTSGVDCRVRGALGKDVLERLKDYATAHLDQSLDVTTLAKMAGRSPFHFSRVFARSVGMTPHRYIVRLRLRRAIELVREGRSSLAEIAALTGFADQSHLSRWVRRVHGVSLSQLLD